MEQSKSENDNDPSILTIIVDTNPLGWKLRRQFGSDNMVEYNHLVAQLIIFCHSYTLMNRSNRIVVIANHPTESIVLYPRRTGQNLGGTNSSDMKNDDFVPFCHTLQSVLSKGLLCCAGDDTELQSLKSSGDTCNVTGKNNSKDSVEGNSSLAQALSMALCGTKYALIYLVVVKHSVPLENFSLTNVFQLASVMNRQLQQHPKLQARMLVVQLSKDLSATYNSVMNSIFRCIFIELADDATVYSLLRWQCFPSCRNVHRFWYSLALKNLVW
jgi:Transcription factor Tfb4